MGFEEFFWGQNQGYTYRRFTSLRVPFNTAQIIRLILWHIGYILVLYSWYDHRQYTMLYMTQWGIHLSWIAFTLIRMASQDQKDYPFRVSGYKFQVWRAAIVVFEVAISFEFIITIVFWTLLWKPRPLDIGLVFNILNHSVPLISLLIEFYIQRWRFRYTHLVAVAACGV